MRKFRIPIFLLIVGLCLNLVSCGKIEQKTLGNLQTAYQDEKNDMVTYLAYAKVADDEKLPDAAKLFRAIAKAEEVHAALMEKEIKELGGAPKYTPVEPIVKTTKENLDNALKSENVDKDVMYNQIVNDAENEQLKDAFKILRETKSVENQITILLKAALENYESLNSGNATYFVCKVCGFPARKLNFAFCPICMKPQEEFIEIQ